MKDRVLLLVAGIFFAALSWAILHYLGMEALWIILCLSTAAENVRLRRQLRDKTK
jgi:uncharacterized membrane protein